MDPDASIFQSNNVNVSRTLVRVGGVSYPVNGIGSVFVRKPNNGFLYLLALVLGIVSLNLFKNIQNGQTDSGAGVFMLLVTIALVALAIARPSTLVLKTASGDQQALLSRDKNHLFNVKGAIEQAVAQRGKNLSGHQPKKATWRGQ